MTLDPRRGAPLVRRSEPARPPSRSRIARPLVAALLVLLVAPALPAAETTEAAYPLLTDLADTTGTYDDVQQLTFDGNTPAPPDQGICSPGNYYCEFCGPQSGEDIRTPDITGLTSGDFQLDVEYRLDTLNALTLEWGMPVVVGGPDYRWISIWVTGIWDDDGGGHLAIRYNNGDGWLFSDILADSGAWHSASLRHEAGRAELLIDGAPIVSGAVAPLDTAADHIFTVNDFGWGAALDGCIRNLRLANDTTLVSLFRDGFGSGSLPGGWSVVETGVPDP